MTRLRTVAAIAIALTVGAVRIDAQQAQSDYDLLAKGTLAQRMTAFDRLQARHGAFAHPEGATALHAALVRENRVLRDALAESGGRTGASEKYGEGYAEYYAELLGACDEHCDKRSAAVVQTLADGAYNAGNDYSVRLAREHGATILPVFLRRLEGGNAIQRREALVMVGVVLRESSDLPEADAKRGHGVLVDAARDKRSFLTRQVAVRTLGDLGWPRDSALLRRIAESDGYSTMQQGRRVFPVREEALRALAKLRR